MSSPKPVLYTTTHELFQLARVYYQVFNQKTVLGVFKRLRCVDFDSTKNRWVWLFEHEARKVRLGKPHHQLPKNIRPLIIGSFTFRGENQMLLDVRSFERATQAIQFFAKRINRHTAKVTHLRVVNKLFPADQEHARWLIEESPDVYFDRDDIPPPKGEALMEKFEQLTAEYEDIELRRQAAFALIEQDAAEPLPEVEEMPAHFYEDGIEALETSLKLKQIELVEHWRGNESVNSLNLIQNLLVKRPLDSP
jgi:hypothetical protein